MADAAAEEGLRLYSASPYRSYAAQERVYQRYAAQQGAEAADTYSARPGFSEHRPAWPWTSIPPAAVPISRPPRPTAGS